MKKARMFGGANPQAAYENWFDQLDAAGQYEEIQETPCIIAQGKDWKADAFIECKTAKTALKRFGKAFEKIYFNPAFAGWLETIAESIEAGIFTDARCEDSQNGYGWGVECQDNNLYYVWLNAKGIFAE